MTARAEVKRLVAGTCAAGCIRPASQRTSACDWLSFKRLLFSGLRSERKPLRTFPGIAL